MTKYIIRGGNELNGSVCISGAKNAAVGIIPAALMVDGVCRIENIPQIDDVSSFLRILHGMGAGIKTVNRSTMDIDCTHITHMSGPYDLMRKIRASYYLLGAMLGRFGEAKTTLPGGCDFGVRPIDQHIKGFRALGAEVEVKNGFIYASVPGGRLHGASIFMDVVSVGATINVMLAASLAEGTFGLYEPIHGSAPDIAGQGKANPLATILSGAMMLRYTFGESEAADAIEKAVDKALTKARTPDIFEEGFEAVSTSQMGDIVVSLL